VNGTVKLLVVDRDPATLENIAAAVCAEEVLLFTATDAQSCLELASRERPQIALLDPATAGLDVLDRLLETDPGITVFIVTAEYSVESAVEAIRRGAHDYLRKPLSIDRMREEIEKWQAEAGERQRTFQLDQQLMRAFHFEGMVGRSPLMLDVYSRIRRVAPHFSTVLITGETGTGKELVATALHRLSPSAHGPLVVCNSTAIVETLF
jgi:DNA-binding NtrC family response regulator